MIALIIAGVQMGSAKETREENAARLIAQNEQFKKKVTELHGRADAEINGANRLNGQAQQLQIKLKAGTPEYKEALVQYEADINEFRNHANAYNAHINDFEKTVGACHANEQQYQANLKQFELHTKDFHLPNVKPPHICVRLNVSDAQAAKMANSMRMDEMRILSSEQELNKQENRLKVAEQESLLAAKKATNAAERDKREQELAAEFGKLKEEYDLLTIEKTAISGTVALKTPGSADSSVHGQIKR